MIRIKDVIDNITTAKIIDVADLDFLDTKPKEVKKALLKILTAYSENKKLFFSKNKKRNSYLFPIIYSAEKQITEAFPYILKCFEVNSTEAYDLYEDITNDISSIIYYTFDGNHKLLETFIDNETIDENIRNEALMAYFKLVSDKKIHKRVFNNFISKRLELMSGEATDEKIEKITYIAVYIAEFHIYSAIDIMKQIVLSDYFDETISGDYEHYVDKMFSYDGIWDINTFTPTYKFIERAYLYRLYDFPNGYELEDKTSSERTVKKKQMMEEYIAACKVTKPKNISKNDLCFCGSGIKYRNCCMGKRDEAFIYQRLDNYYDLLIDYPEVKNLDKDQKGLSAFYCKDAIDMDKLFYKAFHNVNIPTYIPRNYAEENLIKAGYIIDGLDIAYKIIRENKIEDEDLFNEKYMIHYEIFPCINHVYKIIHDEHYPVPQLNEKIKELIYCINKYFKGTIQ